MRPKICENFRTANFNQMFTGFKENSIVDMERCADSWFFVVHRLVALITRMTD